MGAPTVDRLNLLVQLLHIMSEDGCSDALVQRVAEVVRDFCGCDAASVSYRLRGHTRTVGAGLVPDAPPDVPCTPAGAGNCACAAAMDDQRTLAGSLTGSGGAVIGPCLAAGMAAWLVVPLAVQGRTIGVLRVADRRPDRFSPGLQAALEQVAPAVAGVMNALRQREELTRAYDKVDALHRFALNLARADERQQVYDLTVGALEGILEYSMSLISVHRDGYLEPAAVSSGTPAGGVRRFRVDEGIAGKTFRLQRTFYGADVRAEPDAAPASSAYRSFISTPVGRHGVLQVVSTRVGAFDSGDVKLVELVAHHAEEALNRIDLLERLRHEAIHDSLTGLYNRRYFNEFLGSMVANARRYGYRLCFLLFDLNGFKRVNDAFGHLTGDEVLKLFAQCLRRVARRGDVLIRLGGDEFLMIYRADDAAASAQSIVERLQRAFASEVRRRFGTRVSVAAGWSYLDPDDDGGVIHALSLADRHMYQAKAAMGPEPR